MSDAPNDNTPAEGTSGENAGEPFAPLGPEGTQQMPPQMPPPPVDAPTGQAPPTADYGQAPPAQDYGQQAMAAQPQQYGYAGQPAYGANPNMDPLAKSKLVAGLLGIFLGGFGVHRFYLGYTTIGIVQIVVTILTCGIASIWGLVEGIMILVGSDSFKADAEGRLLKD